MLNMTTYPNHHPQKARERRRTETEKEQEQQTKRKKQNEKSKKAKKQKSIKKSHNQMRIVVFSFFQTV